VWPRTRAMRDGIGDNVRYAGIADIPCQRGLVLRSGGSLLWRLMCVLVSNSMQAYMLWPNGACSY
jgi:hypothetical protein